MSKAGTGPKKGKEAEQKAPAKVPEKPVYPLDVLQRNCTLLDKYAETRDVRLISRVFRYTNFLRQFLPISELLTAVDSHISDAGKRTQLAELAKKVDESKRKTYPAPPAVAIAVAGTPAAAAAPAEDGSMALETAAAASTAAPVASPTSAAASAAAPKPRPSTIAQAELEAYFTVLLQSMLASQGAWADVITSSLSFIDAATAANKRTLDTFLARAYKSLSLAQESQSSSPKALEALRPMLVAAHRTACLRHDEFGQATLLNLLLRGYILNGQYDQAAKLIANSSFPEAASGNQLVRYLYYKGRVLLVQLEYSEALASLMQALRKAPPAALGFRGMVSKAVVLVQLLMGEVPERAMLKPMKPASTAGQGAAAGAAAPAAAGAGASSGAGTAPEPAGGAAAAGTAAAEKTADDAYLAAVLRPYFELTKAVRAGDLKAFGASLAASKAQFEQDGLLSLVHRLEATVIKAGLRKISLSYSRVSFLDIAKRLGLPSAEDAEFMCAKCLRDGVLEGSLDHEAGVFVSAEAGNVYLSAEPQQAFHRRIAFCMDVHNEAVKGMRYPPAAHRADLESAERAAEEAALAEAIEEGDLDDFDGDDGPM